VNRKHLPGIGRPSSSPQPTVLDKLLQLIRKKGKKSDEMYKRKKVQREREKRMKHYKNKSKTETTERRKIQRKK
jgi:hypothetical protein